MCSARSSSTVSTRSGSEAAAASSGLGGYWNRLQILVVMVWKPAGKREDGGRAEQRHRLQEGDQRAGKQRRHGERNGDAARGGPGAAAEDGGSVLEIAGDAIERIGDQHEDVGKGVAGDHEDQPGQRVDVEQIFVLRRPGQRAKGLVDAARCSAPPAVPRRWRRETAA